MAYLIDSDWTIDHLNNVPEAVVLVQTLIPEGAFMSVITYLEAFEGTIRDANPSSAVARLQRLTSVVPVLI